MLLLMVDVLKSLRPTTINSSSSCAVVHAAFLSLVVTQLLTYLSTLLPVTLLCCAAVVSFIRPPL